MDLTALRLNPEWRHPFRVYLGCLVRAGWTKKALGQSLGLSSERVRKLALVRDYAEQSLSEYRLILGLPLPVPPPPALAYSGRGRPRQTHCLRGHPLSGDNVYVHPKYRACRECGRLRRAGKI